MFVCHYTSYLTPCSSISCDIEIVDIDMVIITMKAESCGYKTHFSISKSLQNALNRVHTMGKLIKMQLVLKPKCSTVLNQARL